MNLSTYFEKQGRGSAAALAKEIVAHSSDVSDWTKGLRPVPAERCPAIEQATGGLVRCEDLRPDVPWSVVRGNATPAPANTVPSATESVAQGVT